MPRPRKTLVSLEATSCYHCVSRCVRRAFLCGDAYEHRREWVENRILELASVFAIDVAAYAVMSNHYHLVLHINSSNAENWSDKEVCHRWHRLFKGTPLSLRYARDEVLDRAEEDAVKTRIAVWRERLTDISWFMRLINEPIARAANAEDGCTGRFWEGRFTSQALLDEKALAACMAYVDLNPIRAKMADTPESSQHTSVQRRILARGINPNAQPASLMAFVGNPREPMPEGLPFNLEDYLELVDWTGRILRDDKRGAIPANLPPILDRLAIEPKSFLYMSRHFESQFKGLVGSYYSMKKAFTIFGYRRSPGLRHCKQVFG